MELIPLMRAPIVLHASVVGKGGGQPVLLLESRTTACPNGMHHSWAPEYLTRVGV